jgi:hypothetical protein
LEFLKGDIMKPLAKSLHTVTVLVRVAHEVRNRQFPPLPADSAVTRALDILGLTEQPDSYGLAAAAIKQLNKFS